MNATATINGTPTPAPEGAIAWKYADPTEDGRWLYDIDEVEAIEAEDPSLIVYLTDYDADELAYQLRRVFGREADARVAPGGYSVHVEGWPARQTYTAGAVDVLTALDTHLGTTEDGDAEACAAIERARALIR